MTQAAEAAGEARALRRAIAGLCRALNIELTPTRQAALGTMDTDDLQALFDRITDRRCWDV